MDDYVSDLDVLNKSDEVFHKFLKDTISLSSFEVILNNLFINIKKVLPSIIKIKVCGKSIYSDKNYCFEYKDYELEEIKEKDEIFSFNKKLFDEKNNKIGEIYLFIKESLTLKDKKFLDILLKHIATPLGVSFLKEIMLKDLEKNNKILYEKSIKDPLTGLFNREYMNEFLQNKINESKRYLIPLSIAIIDIDFFKKINDTYGHLIGDCVLKELANLLLKHFRNSDTIIRYGGEEILVIMPFSKLNDAYKKMENFRELVEKHIFCGKKNIKLTISVGVSEFRDENVKSLIEKTDKNLYKAKKSGRNKVICKEIE